MKYFDWNDEKNEMLKKVRDVSFEQVELAITSVDLVDSLVRVPSPSTIFLVQGKRILNQHIRTRS